MLLSTAYNDFILYKSTYLKEKSLRNYKDFLKRFIDFVGNDCKVEDIDQELIYLYMQKINQSDLSIATKSTYIRNLKIFIRYICEDLGINKNVKINKIKQPKEYKKNVKSLTPAEINLLFSAISTESDWITYRNKLMIALMLDSGLRQGELRNIKLEDIDYENKTIKIIGKGDKERIVPLGCVSADLMKLYFMKCPYESEYLLIGRRGERISNDAVKHMIYKLDQKLPFHIYSHLFRHNFGTNYLLRQLENDGQCDIYSLMTIMGHSEVKTTMIYLHHAQSLYASKHYNSYLDSIYNNQQ